MSDNSSVSSEEAALPAGDSWAGALPDGAVSVDGDRRHLILRASRGLQARFEELLTKQKSEALSPSELLEYNAITELDDALSWLNRLARQAHRG